MLLGILIDTGPDTEPVVKFYPNVPTITLFCLMPIMLPLQPSPKESNKDIFNVMNPVGSGVGVGEGGVGVGVDVKLTIMTSTYDFNIQSPDLLKYP